ncbi:MAG TPA: hypothetical protein VGH20_21770, partial [Myxococcales bacterium]
MNPFARWTFRSKILAVIAVVSLLPLIITAVVEWRESTRMIDRSNETLLSANALDLARDLDAMNEEFRRNME